MDKMLKVNSKAGMVLKALLAAYVITGLLLLLLAFLLLKFQLKEGVISVGILIIYVLSCFIGGFIIGKKTGEKKYLWGLLLGASYFVLLTVISLLVNKELQSEVGNFFTVFCMCLGSSALGGMVS